MKTTKKFDELSDRFKTAFQKIYGFETPVELYQGWVYFGCKSPWIQKTNLDGFDTMCNDIESGLGIEKYCKL